MHVELLDVGGGRLHRTGSMNLCWILCFLPVVTCFCFSGTYIAETSQSYLTHKGYSNNEDCTFRIVPSSGYDPDDYYLEISWITFDVKGDMPACETDYVEIFLTRSRYTTGRFCSNNLQGSSLFKMYSHDGHALIKFHSDGSDSGAGFALQYRMIQTSNGLPGYEGCSSQVLYSPADNFYSAKWPQSYRIPNSYDCTFAINQEGSKKLVFMDLDFKKSYFTCNEFFDDHMEIRGAHVFTDYYSAELLKGPICSTSNISTFVTSYKYVFVRFKKEYGLIGGNRGLLGGYVTYDVSQKDLYSSLLVAAVSVPCLIIMVAFICCCYFIIRRRRRKLQRPPVLLEPQQNQRTGQQPPSEHFVECPAEVQCPPSYEEAISTPYQTTQGSATSGQDIPPPSYNLVCGSR